MHILLFLAVARDIHVSLFAYILGPGPYSIMFNGNMLLVPTNFGKNLIMP